MTTPLDPATIMKVHCPRRSAVGSLCASCYGNEYWPCLPYRLAEAVEKAKSDVLRLRAQNKTSSDAWTKRTAQMQSELDRRRQDARRGVRLLNEAVGKGENIGWSNNDLQQMIAYLDRLAEVRGQQWPEWVKLDQFRAALVEPTSNTEQ